ncbi:MAG: Gfo/Idh/MocA family oxidoreductase [Acidimicrobiia bacterium]
MDWILLLLDGPPSAVTTTRHKRVWHDITNDDQVRVRLAWADGREAEFLQSDIAGMRRPKLYVQGTEGTVAGHYRPVVTETVEHVHGYRRRESHHAEAPVELTLARYEPGYGLTQTTLPPLPAEAWPFHRNLADHLLLGEPLEVDAADVRRVIRVLEAAQRSGDEGGRTIELEPAG